jgi:short-subunit dehydrogenase
MGLAIARRFGREGYSLGLISRREQRLAESTAELGKSGIRSESFAADASDVKALRTAFADIESRLGPPEVLVYNAAGATAANPSSIDAEGLVQDFRVSVVGAVVAAQAVIPAMRARKAGTILFTGGGFAFEPIPVMASLGVGKAAIRNLAFSFAKELESDGIHVATVTIGGVVKPGTAFDPDVIAEEYWKLHQQPAGSRQRESIFRPSTGSWA